MRIALMDYNEALESGRDAAGLEDDNAWRMHRPELSFRIWKFWKSFDFQVPLFEGGVLNYPFWLMEDIATLNWLNRIIRRDMGFDGV